MSVMVNNVNPIGPKIHLGYDFLGLSKRSTLVRLIELEGHTLKVRGLIPWVWVLACIKRRKLAEHQYLFPSS